MRGVREITSDGDVRAVLTDPARFSSAPMGVLDRVLIGADPPEHAPVRRLVGAALRATAVPDGAIAAVADALLTPMLARGEGEVVADLARPLAAAVTAAQLGIDPAAAPDLLRFGDAVSAVADGRPPDVAAFADLDLAVARWAASRRSCPTGDGISIVVTGARGQAQLKPREVRSLVRLLVVAGIVTSARLSAVTLLAVAADPEMQARVRARPADAARVVEEALRRDPPLRFVLRQAADGDVVACRLDEANRDPAAHPDPERFDIDRDEPHLAFGAGAHRCPGAGLARRQAKVLLQTALGRTSVIAPAGDAAWDRDRHLQGPAAAPLRFGTDAQASPEAGRCRPENHDPV